MDVVQTIRTIIEPSLEAQGYALVLVKLGDGRRKTLTVMAERSDGRGMSVDDCTKVSRTVSALLDVEDPIDGAYDLEVCSPGIDRPLVKASDFKRYAGQEAKLETYAPVDGRRRFRGTLGGVEAETVAIQLPEGDTVAIAINNIRSARLVITDALLKKKETTEAN